MGGLKGLELANCQSAKIGRNRLPRDGWAERVRLLMKQTGERVAIAFPEMGGLKDCPESPRSVQFSRRNRLPRDGWAEREASDLGRLSAN